MSYQEDLILSIYGRGEPGLAMADPLPKGPNRDEPVQAPGQDGVPSSPYLPGKSPYNLAMDFEDALPRGGFIGTSRTNVFINDGGEAYIREPNGNFKFDGMYDPARHGPVFPRAQANDDMKIARGFVKNVGQPVGVRDYVEALGIIDETETNPLMKHLRRLRLEKSNPLDPGLRGG